MNEISIAKGLEWRNGIPISLDSMKTTSENFVPLTFMFERLQSMNLQLSNSASEKSAFEKSVPENSSL